MDRNYYSLVVVVHVRNFDQGLICSDYDSKIFDEYNEGVGLKFVYISLFCWNMEGVKDEV